MEKLLQLKLSQTGKRASQEASALLKCQMTLLPRKQSQNLMEPLSKTGKSMYLKQNRRKTSLHATAAEAVSIMEIAIIKIDIKDIFRPMQKPRKGLFVFTTN